MLKKNGPKILASLAMLGLAAYFAWSWWRDQRTTGGQVYFYDQSAQKLFPCPFDSVSPIAGIDGPEADAVRAIVFSPTGDCARDRQIGYLEKYSPQLKAQFEVTQKNPNAEVPRLSRSEAQSHTFVRRLRETGWHALDTEEGGRIVGEWRLSAPEGTDPTICLP